MKINSHSKTLTKFTCISISFVHFNNYFHLSILVLRKLCNSNPLEWHKVIRGELTSWLFMTTTIHIYPALEGPSAQMHFQMQIAHTCVKKPVCSDTCHDVLWDVKNDGITEEHLSDFSSSKHLSFRLVELICTDVRGYWYALFCVDLN